MSGAALRRGEKHVYKSFADLNRAKHHAMTDRPIPIFRDGTAAAAEGGFTTANDSSSLSESPDASVADADTASGAEASLPAWSRGIEAWGRGILGLSTAPLATCAAARSSSVASLSPSRYSPQSRLASSTTPNSRILRVRG